MKINNFFTINIPKFKNKKSEKNQQFIKSGKYKQTPNNPDYWQNSVGIHFKSKNSQENTVSQEFIDKNRKKMISELDKQLKNQELTEYGIDNYINGLSAKINISDEEKEYCIQNTIKALNKKKLEMQAF